jgi:hypothetical protein
MAESLKSNMHHRRKIGMSDTSTTYYSSWQSKLNVTDEAHSHMFMTSNNVTLSTQRKHVLQYRYGLLPTEKLLYRYKKVKSTACPLCSGEDGGHHAVSSCPALSKAVTLRHNDAGTAILKAILKAIHQGCKGRLLLTSEVGGRKRHGKETEPSLSQAATTRHIQVNHLLASIPIHIKDALSH